MTTEPAAVRSALIGDLDTIVDFNAAMAVETENRRLDETILRDGVRAALTHDDYCLYFVAERAGKIVGQCMVTYEWCDWRNAWMWWFQSVYVPPEDRRTGVFASLYRHVEAEARSRSNVCGLRLYVENDNTRAMETYRKMGMVPAGYIVFERDWSPLGQAKHAK